VERYASGACAPLLSLYQCRTFFCATWPVLFLYRNDVRAKTRPSGW
jgi:hypothetical protein